MALSLLCWQRRRNSLSTLGDGTLSSPVLAAVMALSLSTRGGSGDGTLSLLAAAAEMALSLSLVLAAATALSLYPWQRHSLLSCVGSSNGTLSHSTRSDGTLSLLVATALSLYSRRQQ